MGNCFSDPSKGGQRLGSAPSSSPASGPQAPASASGGGGGPPAGGKGRTLSGSAPQAGGGEGGHDPRSAAAAAAEARAQAANHRGVSASNPGAGRLSSKLQEERRGAAQQQGKPNERMMDAGQWN